MTTIFIITLSVILVYVIVYIPAIEKTLLKITAQLDEISRSQQRQLSNDLERYKTTNGTLQGPISCSLDYESRTTLQEIRQLLEEQLNYCAQRDEADGKSPTAISKNRIDDRNWRQQQAIYYMMTPKEQENFLALSRAEVEERMAAWKSTRTQIDTNIQIQNSTDPKSGE